MTDTEKNMHIEYAIASQEAVAELHQRFLKHVTDSADDVVKIVVGGKTDDDKSHFYEALHAAAVDILLYAARMRVTDYTSAKIADTLKNAANDNDLVRLVANHKYTITAAAQRREEAASASYGAAEVPLTKMEEFRTAAACRPVVEQLEKAFNGEDRIYLRIQCAASPLHAAVERALISMPPAQQRGAWGYRIVDWSAGKATDYAGKQIFRIGKLLQDHAPHLLDDFKRRATDGHMVVISRNVDDIARASTNRAWQTCAGAGARHHYAFGKMGTGIKAGMMIAYLVSINDPHINNPLARIMIKPFVRDPWRDRDDLNLRKRMSRCCAQWLGRLEKDKGDLIWFPDGAHGLKNASFEAVVKRFVDEHFNMDAVGRFWLAEGVYKENFLELTERRHGRTERRTTRWAWER